MFVLFFLLGGGGRREEINRLIDFYGFGAPSWDPSFLPNRSQEGFRAQGKHFLNDAMFLATQGVPQGEIFLDSGVDFHGFST